MGKSAIILAMNEKALQFVTYYEKQEEIVKRFVKLRKDMKISQKRLAIISDVSYASIRRFENTGEISFTSLIKIMLALQLYEELDILFKERKIYTSIEELITD